MEIEVKQNDFKTIGNLDCFAYDNNKVCCKALERMYCKHEKCRFYKTTEQNIFEKNKAEYRAKNKKYLLK